MNEQANQEFSAFAKKQFKKIPKDALPELWDLHERISETFDEDLARLICQFYLDTQVIIGETAKTAKLLTVNIKSELDNLKKIEERFGKVNFADLPPPEKLRQKAGAIKPTAPPPKPE